MGRNIKLCPNCQTEIIGRVWYEDYWLVEERYECGCGYVYHWAYGSVLEDE